MLKNQILFMPLEFNLVSPPLPIINLERHVIPEAKRGTEFRLADELTEGNLLISAGICHFTRCVKLYEESPIKMDGSLLPGSVCCLHFE
jgi:hypothetical protein